MTLQDIFQYLPDSDFIHQLTSNHGLSVTRTYESHRDIITQVKNQFGTNVISQYDYEYDEFAQRTSMTTSGTAIDTVPQSTVPEQDITYTTNALNQDTSIQSSGSSIQLMYDGDGNLTNDDTFENVYDAENRLISATLLNSQNEDKKTEYAYDDMSRRVQKKVFEWQTDHWSLSTEYGYMYDGWNLILNFCTKIKCKSFTNLDIRSSAVFLASSTGV